MITIIDILNVLDSIFFYFGRRAHLSPWLFSNGNRKVLYYECSKAKCSLFVFFIEPLFIIPLPTPWTIL